MMRLPSIAAALLATTLFGAWHVEADKSPAPEITSQGFRLDVEQRGMLRKFDRIRIRIEAGEKIEELRIRERSYEVDLANTPDRAHFSLFGLKARPKARRDVTLNFQNYINAKIDRQGRYEIHIRVVDEQRQSSSAVLMIQVGAEKPIEQEIDASSLPMESDGNLPVELEPSAPIETADFTLQRIGEGNVTGATELGITWKTVASAPVTIQLSKAEFGADKLVVLQTNDFDGIETKTQLNQKVADAEVVEHIKLATTNDRAADRVFAVVNRDSPYILKVERSETSFSPRYGTTVTLNGKYKH